MLVIPETNSKRADRFSRQGFVCPVCGHYQKIKSHLDIQECEECGSIVEPEDE